MAVKPGRMAYSGATCFVEHKENSRPMRGSIYTARVSSGCRTRSGGTQQQSRTLMAGPNGWARSRPNRRQLTHPRGAAGHRRGLRELVHTTTAVLRWPCISRIGHRAQDIYQEAFLKAYKNVGNFASSVLLYLDLRIVTNLCLDHCGRNRCEKKTRRRDRCGR